MRDLVKLFKLLLIAIGMFFSFFIGLFIFVTIHGRDVSNVTSSISINKTIIQNSFSDNQESSNYEYKNDLELKYYNTIEEAIYHKEILDKTAEASESAILKIMQLENEEAYIVCAEKDGSVSGQSIYWYKLKIKDGMYSQLEPKAEVTKWLSENVSDMTADNAISYILDHKDEFNDI